MGGGSSPRRPTAEGGAGSFHEPPSERKRIAALLSTNLLARGCRDPGATAQTVAGLSRCSPRLVAEQLEGDLGALPAAAWAGGWRPAELIRQAKRSTLVNGERLVAFAVAADHAARSPSTLHPRWRLHIEALHLPEVAPGPGWLRSHELAESFTTVVDWPDLIELASAVVFELTSLRRLQELIPPPGSAPVEHSIVDLAGEASSPVLAKVRHLLAQAESTTFDAEAEAFTAKAQELMARHAIDAAVVWARSERTETPSTIRLPIDDPYYKPKGLLLAIVADASHCRAVLDNHYALASVIGFESDLVWCETLFTSLLVQAQRELTRAGAGDTAGGRRRSRSFRSSFLVGYANRIGDRLAEVNARIQQSTVDASTEADGGEGPASLLPVLASRRSAIDTTVDAQFGPLSTLSFRGGQDLLGWTAGTAAAERARLTRGDLETGAGP